MPGSEPRLRVLISAARLGVAGGNQRAVQSWVRALEGHDVLVSARHFDDGPYARLPDGVRAIPSWQVVRGKPNRPPTYWRYAANTFRPRGRFDLYLHCWNGRDLSRLFDARRRYVVPSGAQLDGLEREFDGVLSQTPGGISLLEDPAKHLVVPPPTYPVADEPEEVSGLPREFLLTVLNPYGLVKGADVLAKVAQQSSLPIVWARSSHTEGRIPEVAVPDSVARLLDLRPSQLLDLYQKCTAYVSFSRSEGYGWAIADALLAGKPIISRRVGVLTLFPESVDGLYLYDSVDELESLIGKTSFKPLAVDPSPIQPISARHTLESLCRT